MEPKDLQPFSFKREFLKGFKAQRFTPKFYESIKPPHLTQRECDWWNWAVDGTSRMPCNCMRGIKTIDV